MSITFLETGSAMCDEDFHLIAESIPHIVWVTTADGSAEYFNHRGTDYTGRPPDAGFGWDWVRLVHPDDVASARSGWTQSIHTGEPYENDFRLRRFDGVYRWHTVKGLPVRDAAGQIQKWIGTATDIHDRRQSEHANRQLTQAAIEAISAAADARDPYTGGHQRRVATVSAAIATELGLAVEQIEGIRLGAAIHDIGKLSVPIEILTCPRRLTETEMELVKTHAQIGHDIVSGIDFPWPVADMILQHHERLDGSGYPNGLRGDEIGIAPRIIAVADTVEAMASHRPYRPALGIDVALDEIGTNRGRCYDDSVVDACLRLFERGRLHIDRLE
jgi:PAS domain S-box-containing protein/putative nucleotidyltransferase with HDIG domain